MLKKALTDIRAGDILVAHLGIWSRQDPWAPAVLEPLGPQEAWLTITEGRYHQVRRMFAAAGNHVTGLHRDRIGGLVLPDDLAAGEYRVLPAAVAETVFAG